MITPDFRVTIDSVDITDVIKKGLLSLRITDEAGIKSDKVEIKIDDSNGKIVIIFRKQKLSSQFNKYDSYIRRP